LDCAFGLRVVADSGLPENLLFHERFEFHVFLLAAQKMDAVLFTPEPLPGVDAGTIPNVENFVTLGGPLALC
jgi:hypothetical protein